MTGPRRASPAVRRTCVLVVVVAAVAALVVQPAAPFLLDAAPLLLLVLHPYEPWSLLVSDRFSGLVFVSVVVAVRGVLCCADFWVGRWYGPAATAYLAQHRGGRVAAGVGRAFARARVPAVLVFPGALVSVLSGASDVPPRRFFPVLLLGLTGWALLARAVASSASAPLARVVGLLLGHSALAAGLLLLVVLGGLWRLAGPGHGRTVALPTGAPPGTGG